MPQVWETGGYGLNKNGEVCDAVFVHPQDLQVWHWREDGVRADLVVVQDEGCEVGQAIE